MSLTTTNSRTIFYLLKIRREIVIEIICFLFVLLFMYASLVKLFDVEKFTAQLNQSPILMTSSSYIAWLVPSIEIAISAMLIFSKSRLFGLYGAFTLMVIFTTYIIIILSFARHVPCSCGGILEDMGWAEHLIFNITFSLLAATGVLLLHAKKH